MTDEEIEFVSNVFRFLDLYESVWLPIAVFLFTISVIITLIMMFRSLRLLVASGAGD